MRVPPFSQEWMVGLSGDAAERNHARSIRVAGYARGIGPHALLPAIGICISQGIDQLLVGSHGVRDQRLRQGFRSGQSGRPQEPVA